MSTITRYPVMVGDSSGGGISPATIEHFTRTLTGKGHAVTEPTSRIRPWNHHVVGVGVGHDDARFAETGTSMAVYYENGEAWNGLRWWEDGATSRRYYTGDSR